MFYFQHLLEQGLGGIDSSAVLPGVIAIGYTILLISFLIGIYQAAMRSGDLQALAVASLRYLVVALALANWSSLFREVNSSFGQVSASIAGNGGDIFSAWMDQLSAQLTANGFSALLPAISGGLAAIVTALLVLAAYLIYAVMVAVFAFFYVFYGCLLYVLGPLILALLPAVGINQLARSYAQNLLVWNAWSLLYGVFAALITAIQLDRVDQVMNQGFLLGFFVGLPDSLLLGLVSVFYALALGLIPFIARRILSGDVGSTAWALVRAGSAAVADVRSAMAGFEAGSSPIMGNGGAAALAGAGAPSGSSAATFSGSMPPPAPSLAETIRDDIRSAVEGSTSPPSPIPTAEVPAAARPPAAHTRAAHSSGPGPRAGQILAFGAGKLAAELLSARR